MADPMNGKADANAPAPDEESFRDQLSMMAAGFHDVAACAIH